MIRPARLWHATTPKKLARYLATGAILAPVRGFDSERAAALWASRTGRTVLVEIDVSRDAHRLHMLPDHHNEYGKAWWLDGNATMLHVMETSR